MTAPNDKAALAGVTQANVVWDINAESPIKLARQLKVISRTYTDLLEQGVEPRMVFTLRGPSTTFVTKSTEQFEGDALGAVLEIQSALSDLAGRAGVTLEVCAIASKRMGVAPEALLDYAPLVGNTFCSLIGYQAKGYALIPIA